MGFNANNVRFVLFSICAFCTFLLISSDVSAIDLQNTEIYVDKEGNINFQEYYITNRDFNFTLPEDYYGFYINLDQDKYNLLDNLLIINNLDGSKENNINVEYSTSKFSSKIGNKWILNLEKKDLVKKRENIITIYLPKGARLVNEIHNSNIYTLNNRIIINLRNINQDVSIEYEFFKQEKDYSFIVLIFVVIIIIIVLLLFLRIKKKGFKKEIVQEQPIINTLTENESKIINLLIENRRLTQKKLRFMTGFPKSTLSRTLMYLKKKNMIEMKRVGISNVVYLKEWLKK
ncbi:MAG: hypothetical protein V1663_03925 [archaeon]